MKLYHYTTLEALEKILKEDRICFWGTRYDSVNDSREFVFARDIVIPEMRELLKSDLVSNEPIDDVEFYPYIVSFSELGDNLSMWRFYHSEICVEMDGDRLLDECNEKGILLGKCEYVNGEKEEIAEAISRIHQNLNINDDILLDRIRECSTFVKHKDYEPEAEYRIVKFDYDGLIVQYKPESPDLCEMQEKEIPQDTKVKFVRNGDIVLYKEFSFSKDLVKGITIHEQSDAKFQEIKKHLELVLFDRGYDVQEVAITKTSTYYNK